MPIFLEQFNNPIRLICGILFRAQYLSVNRLIINEINDFLNFKCSLKIFYFINQSNVWTLTNAALVFLSLYTDDLYLVKKSNLKLGKFILKATGFTISVQTMTSPFEKVVCSKSNGCDFAPLPSLSTRCQLISSSAKSLGSVTKAIICCVSEPFFQAY